VRSDRRVCGARRALGKWCVPAGTHGGGDVAGATRLWAGAVVASRLVRTACLAESRAMATSGLYSCGVSGGRIVNVRFAWYGPTTVQYLIRKRKAVLVGGCVLHMWSRVVPGNHLHQRGRIGRRVDASCGSQGFRGRGTAETALARYLSTCCGLSAADGVGV
jgi:hypothetical protein